jgi:WD40 repeat protein
MKTIALFISLFFLLQSLCAQKIETVLQRNSAGECKVLAISSDGMLIAKVNANQMAEIEIWNTKTKHLVRTINTGGSSNFGEMYLKSITQLHFWKGSKFLVTGTFNGVHEIYDLQNGKMTKTLCSQSYIDGVSAVNEKTGTFAAIHPLDFSKSNLLLFDLFNNVVFDSVSLGIGSISAISFSPNGDKMAIGTEDGSFHIFETETYNRTLKAEGVHPSKIFYLQWTPDNYLLVNDTSMFSLWNMDQGKLTSNGKTGAGARVVTSPSEDCFFIADNKGIRKKPGGGTEQRRFGIEPDMVYKLSFADNRLYALTQNFVRVFDMNSVSQSACEDYQRYVGLAITEKNKERWLNNFTFNSMLKSYTFTSETKYQQKGIFDNQTDKELPIDSKKLISILRTSDNKLIYTQLGKLPKGINIIDEDVVKTLNSTREDSLLFVSPNGKLFGTVPVKGEKIDTAFMVYDVPTKKRTPVSLKGSINCAAYSSVSPQFAVGGTNLYLFDAVTLKYIRLFDPSKETFNSGYGGVSVSVDMPENYRNLFFSPNGKHLFAASKFGHLKVWNLATKKIDTVFNATITSMVASTDGKRLFIATGNEILLLKTTNLQVEAHIALLSEGDYIVNLPDNIYKSSKKGSQAIVFRKGVQTYNFEQFDLVYNQPDVVTQHIGNPTPAMIDALKKAKMRRLKKAGFTEALNNSKELNAPEIAIVNYNKLPTISKDKMLSFSVQAFDEKYFLSRFNVFVNGVAAGESAKGYELSKMEGTQNKQRITFNYSVALAEGNNMIEVVCMNDKGLESLKESFEVIYSPQTIRKPNLYLITIGVSEYSNPEFNLKYPVKDMQDIIATFRENSQMFGEIKVMQLTNKEVTAQSVMALKQNLANTDVSDYVLVFWAGHGLLSSDLDYYLATYNVDFNKPENNGLHYATLESLFEGIPARKKALFIDACHSGEVDKDNSQLVATIATNQGTVKSRGFKSLKSKENGLGLSNSFDLMQELFSDVQRGNGANIISAAGGAEFAFESDTWKNGVFTYSLLNGLNDGNADLDGDGQVMLSELQKYIQSQVFSLTKGQQKPTSRVENLYNDFPLVRNAKGSKTNPSVPGASTD